MNNLRHPIACRRTRAQSGFTLIEVMIGVAILVVALLGHSSASWTASRLALVERSRSEGLRFAQQFIERLRTEEDFANLYARLDGLERGATAVAEAAAEGEDFGFNLVVLNDGRTALPPQAYFADFEDPPGFDEVGVLVDVPGTVGLDGLPILREDANAPEFGLPWDLNGDGTIDADNCAGNYRAVPAVIYVRYRLDDGLPYEFRMVTWLRGDR